jgi:hypothetical protein
MDIESTPPNGDPSWIDVTVVNSIGRTHKGKPLDATFDKKDAEKKNTYATLAKEKKVQLLTFACDVFGTLSKDSLNLLRSTASAIKLRAPDATDRDSLSEAAIFTGVSKAIAFGNGTCLFRSGQMRRFGMINHGDLCPIRASECTGVPTCSDSDNATSLPPSSTAIAAPAAHAAVAEDTFGIENPIDDSDNTSVHSFASDGDTTNNNTNINNNNTVTTKKAFTAKVNVAMTEWLDDNSDLDEDEAEFQSCSDSACE